MAAAKPSVPVAVPLPKGRWCSLINGLLVIHLALITVSYLGVVQPSSLQQTVLTWAAPYLHGLHWAPESGLAAGMAGDGIPLYLARGNGSERVLRIETNAGRSDTAWQPLLGFTREDGGLQTRRQQRFLAALAQLGLNDQNALASRLVLPLVGHPLLSNDQPPSVVRVIRLPNLMTNVAQDHEPPPYSAVLLQTAGGVRLVSVPESRLTASALPAVPTDQP